MTSFGYATVLYGLLGLSCVSSLTIVFGQLTWRTPLIVSGYWGWVPSLMALVVLAASLLGMFRPKPWVRWLLAGSTLLLIPFLVLWLWVYGLVRSEGSVEGSPLYESALWASLLIHGVVLVLLILNKATPYFSARSGVSGPP